MKSRKNIKYKKYISKKGGTLSVGIKARIDMGFKKNPNFDLNEILKDYENDNIHKEIFDYAIKKGYINMDRIQGLNNSLLHHILSRSIKNPKNIKKTTETSRKIKNIVKNYKIQDRSIYNNIRNFEKKKKFINWAKDYLKDPYFETIFYRFNGNNIEYLVYEPPNRGDGMWASGVFNEKADHFNYNETFPKILNPYVLQKNNTTILLNFFNSSNKNNDDTITQLISKYKEQEEYINKLYEQEKYNELDEWWKNHRVDCFKQIGIYLAELNGFHDITNQIFE